jgi:hypothetical protein
MPHNPMRRRQQRSINKQLKQQRVVGFGSVNTLPDAMLDLPGLVQPLPKVGPFQGQI